LVDGKARLVSESYCDGLGNCLPECPAGAITIEEQDAAAFDEEAVQKRMKTTQVNSPEKPGEVACGCGGTENAAAAVKMPESLACGCPGTSARLIEREECAPHLDASQITPAAHGEEHDTLACGCPGTSAKIIEREECAPHLDASQVAPAAHEGEHDTLACGCPGTSVQVIDRDECAQHADTTPAAQPRLRQWPCQIKLVPVNAPYLDHADLLVAADCSAYAYASLHNDFMKGRITLIGCPKLDDTDYAEKLTEILKAHEIRSIKVLRMEVPCCGGIVDAVKQALINSGRMIPWGVVTIGTDGRIVEQV
jgi:NAD-dependent dihydropyrimidine dehydrogenase PreA subunit